MAEDRTAATTFKTTTKSPTTNNTTIKGGKLELTLPTDKSKDKLGGYVINKVDVTCGYRIATYEWEPKGGFDNAKAIVFLLHGILAHSAYEWLMPDSNNHRVLLKGSIIEKLLDSNIGVVSHDHPAHGRSSGLHAYVNSHDELRDASIEIIHHYKKKSQFQNKKTILLGMSMGGTTAIRVCEKSPDLIDCYILLSPAVRPPDNMFGWHGRFLRFISPILDYFVPKLPVLSLPPSPDPMIRDAAHKDGLLYRTPIRVRMGIEFLRVYSEINDNAHLLRFQNVAIFSGGKDQIVSPTGILQFVERIQSDHKQVFSFPEFGHDVIREVGTEKVIKQIIDYVNNYISSSSSPCSSTSTTPSLSK